jgi:hypothetical protein
MLWWTTLVSLGKRDHHGKAQIAPPGSLGPVDKE